MAAPRRAGPSRGPQARGDRTREGILDAVLELVARGGPRAVTYRAVAEVAGVAQGVMTYHFPTRRDLIAEAFRHHLGRLRDSARELPAAAARAPSRQAAARLVYRFLRDMVQRDRLRYLAEFEITLELARDPELAAEVAPEADRTRGFARELLEASGSPHPLEDAMLMGAAMEGLALEWLARPGDRAFARQVQAAVERLVELFFPRGRAR